jgi:hypothetical protein
VNAVNFDVAKRWESLTDLIGSIEDRRISFYADKILPQPIILNTSLICNRSDFSSFMNSIRFEAYRRLGIENSIGRYLIILMPRANCIWEGRSLIGAPDLKGGTMILQDTADPFVIAHELGHSLGLGHSNFLRCELGQKDGLWNICKAVEYGGTVDLMGNVVTSAPLSTYHQWRMGLLKNDQVKEVWRTESVSLSSIDMAKGLKAIFIRDGLSSYWLEFRRERLESGYGAGLVLYRTDPPPPSSVVSPNADDTYASQLNMSVSSDMWLLNLDNFNYANSRSSGSMTLSNGKSFTVFSGNVSFEVTSVASNHDSATVTIKRAADVNAAPKPILAISGAIKSGEESVLQSGFEDRESYVDSFEIKKNEEVIPSSGRSDPMWKQTYLQPFKANKILTVADLPEGKYLLSVRTIDVSGNKSEWSLSQNVNIDRGSPSIDASISIERLIGDGVEIRHVGIKDEGSQLCSTSLYNDFDFVTQSSSEKSSPRFAFLVNQEYVGRIQARDCLGNIRDAKFRSVNTWIPIEKGTKTGKWKSRLDEKGNPQIQCISKCSISISVSENIGVLAKTESSEFLLSGKKVVPVLHSQSSGVMNIAVGARKKVLRIVSKDLVLSGIIQNVTEVSGIRDIPSSTQGIDPTLTLPNQKSLLSLGFSQDDFVNGWKVLPMAGGTETQDPTLDFCGSNYPSENLRLFRRQVAVSRTGTPYAFLSSESVEYRDKLATAQALLELRENLAQCKIVGGVKDSTGLLTKYQFQETSAEEKQLKIVESLIVHAIMGEGTNSRVLFAVYQFRENYFTGLYVVKDGDKFLNRPEIDYWIMVAKTFNSRLKNR